MNASGFPYLTLRWLTAGSTCAHIQSSNEKCGSIWWPWRRCVCTTVLQHEPWTIMHTHSFNLFFCFVLFFTWQFTIHIWSQSEIGICRKYIQEFIQYVLYVLCGFYQLSYSSSFLLPLSALFPGWPYLCSTIVQRGNDEKWSYNASC